MDDQPPSPPSLTSTIPQSPPSSQLLIPTSVTTINADNTLSSTITDTNLPTTPPSPTSSVINSSQEYLVGQVCTLKFIDNVNTPLKLCAGCLG